MNIKPLASLITVLVLSSIPLAAQSHAPALLQENRVTFEPAFLSFVNGLLGREIGKKPKLIATPDLVEAIEGQLPSLDTRIWSFCLLPELLCTCKDLDFEPKLPEIFVSFTIDTLTMYQLPDGASAPGYRLLVRLGDFTFSGEHENAVDFLEICPFTKISWDFTNSLVEFEIPLAYVPGAGFKPQPIPPEYPVLGSWSHHVNVHGLPPAVEDIILDHVVLPLLNIQMSDIDSTLNAFVAQQIQTVFGDLVDEGMNFENPAMAAMEEIILAVNDPSTGLPGTQLSTGKESVAYPPKSARIVFEVDGTAIGLGPGSCPDAVMPTSGAAALLAPWTAPTSAHVSAQLALKILEWINDRTFDAGLACFSGSIDFSNYVPKSILTLSFEPTDFALTSPVVPPGQWAALGETDLGLRATGTLLAQLTLGSIDLGPPMETAVVIDVPILFVQSDAGQTLQLQADADAAKISFPDLSPTDPVIWQAIDQLEQFMKDNCLEPILRPVSNTPALTLNHLELNLGQRFGPEDRATPGVGDTLDLDFGVFYAQVQARSINAQQQLRLDFVLQPVEIEPDPVTALTHVQQPVPGLSGETFVAVTEFIASPTAKYVRFGTPILENAYRPGPTGYVRYYTLSYSAMAVLRYRIKHGLLAPGPITVVPREHTGNNPYVIYSRGLTRREVGIEETKCLSSVQLSRLNDSSFAVRKRQIEVQRLSKYGAPQDAWSVVECSEGGGPTLSGEIDIDTSVQPVVNPVLGGH